MSYLIISLVILGIIGNTKGEQRADSDLPAVRGQMSFSDTPDCTFMRYSELACCINVTYNESSSQGCIDFEMEGDDVVASLSTRTQEVLRRKITIGEQCNNNRQFPACLIVYYIQVSSDGTRDACLFIKIFNRINLDFGCIKYGNGIFEHSMLSLREDVIENIYFSNGLSEDAPEYLDFDEL